MTAAPAPGAPAAVVIEGDAESSALIAALLAECGFTVHTAGTGEGGVAAVLEHAPVLVTLDLGLPGMDGFETARRIRQFSDAYILVVSGSDAEQDLVMAFSAGADDYLTKPFRGRILQARVQTLGRRPRRQPGDGPDGPAPLPGSRPLLERGGLVMDPWARTVQAEGRDVALTRSEFDLLRLFLEGGRRVRTRTQLSLFLGGRRPCPGVLVSSVGDRTIDIYICNLRRKLGAAAGGRRWIQTLRGAGYRLAVS
jgi:two-component system, OmpR family, response regulator